MAIYENLENFEFMIKPQEEGTSNETNYVIYFKDKETGDIGIPVPDLNIQETYYKKYVETILLNSLEEIEPSLLFNNNRYISICCNFEQKERIRKELIKKEAKEENFMYSVEPIKMYKNEGKRELYFLEDTQSLGESITKSSRFKELVFRMEVAGFRHVGEGMFAHENAKIETLKDTARRFYSLK